MTIPAVTAALTHHCGLCGAKPGELCINLCGGGPLLGRDVHLFRMEVK